jgi:hypothetical protein
MTLQRIDDALADWTRRLEAMAANLLWLQAESTYQALTGPGITLSGATAALVQPTLAALPSLFQNFDLLNGTIDRAVAARKGLPMLFGGEQKIAEIEQLLFGKSIKLPIVDVPLAQRTLLGQSHNTACLSPEELLAPMAGIFAAARDAILTVERAWQELAAGIASAEAETEELNLDEARQALAQLRERVQADPLGALEELKSRVQPALDKARAAAASRLEAHREMDRARLQCDSLAALHREAIAAAATAHDKIADCAGLPTPFDERRLAHLREWLDRVERLLRGGELDRFAAELRNWKASAEDCSSTAKKVSAANRAPVEARRELRGRLDALKAKARSRGLAEHAGVSALAKQAEALLATRPTDMKEAAQAVADYAKTLSREGIRQ